MRISLLQFVFLILLFLIFFFNNQFFGKKINHFFTIFLKNLKKYNSFRK